MTTAPAQKLNHDTAWTFSAGGESRLPTLAKAIGHINGLADLLPPADVHAIAGLLLAAVRAAQVGCSVASLAEFSHDLWAWLHDEPAPAALDVMAPRHRAGLLQMVENAGCWPVGLTTGMVEAVIFLPLAEWIDLYELRKTHGKAWPLAIPQPGASE